MYSTVCWVPRGCSSHKPIRAIPTANEIEQYKKMYSEQLLAEEEREKEEMGQEGMEEGVEAISGVLGESIPIEAMDPSKDPNIMVDEENLDSDSEDDLDIRPTDSVLLAAKSDEDQSFLEVHIYDEETGNFYLHHDILLSAYPLSMAWMDCVPQPSTSTSGHPSGSFVAIGTFHPEIEIWNTDVLDALEPEAVLGGLVAGKRRTLKPGSHRQAVMGLSWNREYRNVLASSSADSTVKLWDVTTQHCMLTLNYHKDKVPVVHFHPVEANILLTASYDRVCAVTDGRSPSNGTWIGIPAKPESAAWDLAAPYCFFVSTERGEAFRFDVRQTAAPLFQQQLHEGPCTALALNPAAPSLCASAGEDGLVRLWSVESAGLCPVAERNVNLGSVFACSFYESAPYLLAACGTSQDLCLWDVREVDALQGVFEAGEGAGTAGEAEKLAFEASEKATGTLNDIGKKKRN